MNWAYLVYGIALGGLLFMWLDLRFDASIEKNRERHCREHGMKYGYYSVHRPVGDRPSFSPPKESAGAGEIIGAHIARCLAMETGKQEAERIVVDGNIDKLIEMIDARIACHELGRGENNVS